MSEFRDALGESIFNLKYQHEGCETWANLAKTLVDDVCEGLLKHDECEELVKAITEFKFIPGGRYLYYAGRPNKAYFNCFLAISQEDTREEWAKLVHWATQSLTQGGGIGNDYSVFRPRDTPLSRTGGKASGPIALMCMVNEIGRYVMQGGSRRCQKIDTVVNTLNGTKRIQNIIAGDMVQTPSGYKPVLATEFTGVKPIFEIYTRTGILESTAEHRHAVIRSVKPFQVEWVETKDITENDTLVFSTKHSCSDGGKALEAFEHYIPHRNSLPYTRPTNMSVDLAWFLGALCDGHLAMRGVAFTQRESNVEFLNKGQRIAKSVFGLDSKLTQGHGTLDLRLSRRQLSKDLKRYKSKRQGILIHEDIMNASVEEKLSFIAGVLDADGCIMTTDVERKKGTINFRLACSIDKAWIFDLSRLLSSIGIPVKIRVQGRGASDVNRQPMWRIDLADKSLANIVAAMLRPYSIKIGKDYQEAGPKNMASHGLVVTRSGHNTPRVMGPMDYESFTWPEGILPAKVEKIVAAGEAPTYDIQVADDECFVANGHLTHNSAIYASLNWQHADAEEFLTCKDWPEVVKQQKLSDFNFPGQLDMTNVSLNYDNNFLAYISRGLLPETFVKNVRQAMETGEPGFSFNFGSKVNDTARNACTEVTSSSPFDSCNLGSLNMGKIETAEEMAKLSYLGSKFLYCGTIRGTIDHEETRDYQLKNRRLGLGIMGVHEWILKNNQKYQMTPKLRTWLKAWKENSETGANELANKLSLPKPKGYRAIAPTGSIGILAGTTTGIEPLYAVAYKRRYLKGRDDWHYQYVIDSTASHLIKLYGLNPDNIETASDLAKDYRARIQFQADVQDYVDMAISSTINLPPWGSEHNNEDKVVEMAKTLAEFSPRIRGFTCYPDGSRGGQPLTAIPYSEAIGHEGVEYKEHDICVIGGKGGTCGT